MLLLLLLLSVPTVFAACQSPSDRLCCNDQEMYLQCSIAQQQINDFSNRVSITNGNYTEFLKNRIPRLFCENHYICCYDVNVDYYKKGLKQYVCQNMDSYKICTDAPTALNEFITFASSFVTIPHNMLSNQPSINCTSKNWAYQFSENDSNEITYSLLSIVTLISFVILLL